MGSSSQQPVVAEQSKDPWSGAQPGLHTAHDTALGYFGSDIGYQPYQGQTQIDPLSNPDYASGQSYGRTLANLNPYGSPGVQAGQALGANMIQNQGLNAGLLGLLNEAKGDTNPYLQNILDTSNRRIGDRINASMSGAGRYGSGQHTDVMARALAEAADPLLAADYNRRQELQKGILGEGLQRAGQWSQLAPGLDQAQFANIDRLQAMGEQQRNYQQAQLQDQIKLFNAQQARPWEQIARLNAIASQVGGLGGTQVTSTPVNQPSGLQAGFGGALAGAGLGSMFGPAGAGIGGLGGGLMGLLNR